MRFEAIQAKHNFKKIFARSLARKLYCVHDSGQTADFIECLPIVFGADPNKKGNGSPNIHLKKKIGFCYINVFFLSFNSI